MSRYWQAARRAVGVGFVRTIDDDRGRAVEPWLKRPWWRAESRRAPLSNATIERVIRRIRPRFSFQRRLFFQTAALSLAVLAWLYVALVVWKIQAAGAGLLMLLVALCFMIGLLTQYLQRRTVPRSIFVWRLRDAMVAEGLCASCGYPIRGLEVEADGCAVCPECGAAWKVGEAEAV